MRAKIKTAFLQRYACVAVWNLSGVKSGQEIGKTLSTAQSVAKQASKNQALTVITVRQKRALIKFD